ncbi:MAG: M1 family metallopeptidase, partial [Gammaproteobacteria bacterium]|nr:M1 family metallopeptidase [Gammaproteobacteria bacterium]
MLTSTTSAATSILHDFNVKLDPRKGLIEVRDQITLSKISASTPQSLVFQLHAGYKPRVMETTVSMTSVKPPSADPSVEWFQITLPQQQRKFTLLYGGRITQPEFDSHGRAERITKPTDGQEIYLDGSDFWYPRFSDKLVTFSLNVETPPGWYSLSQGRSRQTEKSDGSYRTHWEEMQPQDDIYLLAAPYQVYKRPTTFAETLVYLLQPDPKLADRYLTATARYLELYTRLIGPYPYAKFALVENSRQTGYGMPSFTLLGSRVIRLPFILHSSYPHEILHNWWGNGVYVDYQSGNWSEGLTAYLADHLLKEQSGDGVRYRRSALQKYADYVAAEQDFPLAKFRIRHGEITQAVGYSKALMFFHMLRREMGDDTFLLGLQRFYRDNRFHRAGYADLRLAFTAESGTDLTSTFHQWIQRTGSPSLHLGEVQSSKTDRGYLLTGSIRQGQTEPAYTMQVPIAVHMEGVKEAILSHVTMKAKQLEFSLHLPSRPLLLEVDPEFDLFRRLHRDELPSSLG